MLEYIKIEFAIVLIVTVAFILGRVIQEYRIINRLTLRAPTQTAEKHDSPGTKFTRRDDVPLSVSMNRRSSSRFQGEIILLFDSIKCNPDKLVDAIKSLCLKNYDAASALFFKGRDEGILTAECSNTDMFLSLCGACIRVGSPHFIFRYFAEMDTLGISRDLVFFNSVVKILTFKKQYKINLALHDAELNLIIPKSFEDPQSVELVKSLFSCFLYSAIEAGEYWRASKFFRMIEKTGISPTENDYSNVIRACIAREDWKGGVQILARSNPESNSRAIRMFTDATVPAQFRQLCDLAETCISPKTVGEIFLAVKRRGKQTDMIEYIIGTGSQELLVQAIQGAIQARDAKSVTALFQAMADAHHSGRNQQGVSPRACVTASTVDILLALAVQASDASMVPQLVELTLKNRLPLAAESVSKLGKTAQLREILRKYQYRAI